MVGRRSALPASRPAMRRPAVVRAAHNRIWISRLQFFCSLPSLLMCALQFGVFFSLRRISFPFPHLAFLLPAPALVHAGAHDLLWLYNFPFENRLSRGSPRQP